MSKRILLVKMSSMGDVIHTLPALNEAVQHDPDLQFDWVVEENFVDLASLHPNVGHVIPIGLRRWRKNKYQALTSGEVKNFMHELRQQSYDLIIDAQGLIKSAVIAKLAKGKVSGLDSSSAREGLAACFYQNKYNINTGEHAILRLKKLFGRIFGYAPDVSRIDYGLHNKAFQPTDTEDYLVFLHGTTWPTKHWPETHWQQLINLATQAGLKIKLPWGNQTEFQRARRLANTDGVSVLPKMGLKEIMGELANAKGVVAVDTGLGHLTAALAVPCVSLYGPTAAHLTGALGQQQYLMQSQFQCSPCLLRECRFQEPTPPCFNELSPELVWAKLQEMIKP